MFETRPKRPTRSFPVSIYQYFQYFVCADIMNFDLNGNFILICFVSNNLIKEHEHFPGKLKF